MDISLRDPNWRLLFAGAAMTIVGVPVFLVGFAHARQLEGQTYVSVAGEVSQKSAPEMALWIACWALGLALAALGLPLVLINAIRWVERATYSWKKQTRGFPLDRPRSLYS